DFGSATTVGPQQYPRKAFMSIHSNHIICLWVWGLVDRPLLKLALQHDTPRCAIYADGMIHVGGESGCVRSIELAKAQECGLAARQGDLESGNHGSSLLARQCHPAFQTQGTAINYLSRYEDYLMTCSGREVILLDPVSGAQRHLCLEGTDLSIEIQMARVVHAQWVNYLMVVGVASNQTLWAATLKWDDLRRLHFEWGLLPQSTVHYQADSQELIWKLSGHVQWDYKVQAVRDLTEDGEVVVHTTDGKCWQLHLAARCATIIQNISPAAHYVSGGHMSDRFCIMSCPDSEKEGVAMCEVVEDRSWQAPDLPDIHEPVFRTSESQERF
ncbi:uncharacterized protein PV07_12694, partial [Cladophialophora immunda]